MLVCARCAATADENFSGPVPSVTCRWAGHSRADYHQVDDASGRWKCESVFGVHTCSNLAEFAVEVLETHTTFCCARDAKAEVSECIDSGVTVHIYPVPVH